MFSLTENLILLVILRFTRGLVDLRSNFELISEENCIYVIFQES